MRVILFLHGLLVRCGHGISRDIPLLRGFLPRRGVSSEVVETECLLVTSPPVILQFSVTPPTLELGASGVFGGCIVEIPGVVSVVHREHLVVLILQAILPPVGKELLTGGGLSLLLLLLLQIGNQFLYDLHLLLGGHRRQPQQRVLQFNILGIDSKLVKHIAAAFQHRVVGIIVRNQRQRLRIARLRLGVKPTIIIKASEGQLRHGLVDARTRGFLHSQLIVLDCLGRVAAREIEVAYGVIYLVEILLVAVVTGHTAQRTYLLGDILTGEHLTLLDAGIEFGAV